MLLVSRLARGADGKERERAGGEVEDRVDRLADDAEAPGQQPDNELADHDRSADEYRTERNELGSTSESLHRPNFSGRIRPSPAATSASRRTRRAALRIPVRSEDRPLPGAGRDPG